MLNVTPVHRNLKTKLTYFGLEFEDIAALIILMVLMNQAGRLVDRDLAGIPLGIVFQYVIPLLAVPLLVLFKHGKPRRYLLDYLEWRIKPQVYCGHEADDIQTTEYLVTGGSEHAAYGATTRS